MGILNHWQDEVLEVLSGKVDNYRLGGGTALSKFYFYHRLSFDLDFFTLNFSRKDIISLVEFLASKTGKDFEIIGEQLKKNRVKIMVFNAKLSRSEAIKVDFIEDYIKRLKPAREINGIRVFALEDIYLRKIYAASGTIGEFDLAGRKISKGGRQEAKDFFDLYFLSHTFMRLSKFTLKYCNITTQEALIHWFRTYSRMDIKTGLLELRKKNEVDYKDMERHFKNEIDKLLESQIGGVL